MKEFNSAARLHEILEEASQHKDDAKQVSVWSSVFGYEESDKIEAFEHAVAIKELIEKVKDDVSHCIGEDASPIYTGELEKIKDLHLGFIHNAQWSANKKKIEGGVLTSLKICSHQLVSNGFSEAVPEEECFESIVQRSDDLFQEVFYSSNLPRSVKVGLCEKISNIKKSIKKYKIHGFHGLEEATSSLVGGLCLHNGSISSLENSQAVFDKSGSFLRSFLSFSSKANSGFDLLKNFGEMIEKIESLN